MDRSAAPDRYASDALVTFSTHDLPTFAGWASGHDLQTKAGAGTGPRRERRATPLGACGFPRRCASPRRAGSISTMPSASWRSTPSRILAVAMEDLQQVRDQPNIPGTINEHPNWRRKLPLPSRPLQASWTLSRLRDVLGSRWNGTEA